MKRVLLIFPVVFIMLVSCEVVVVEEPVPVIIHDVRDHFIGSYHVEEYDITLDHYTEYGFNINKLIGDPHSIVIRNFFGIGIEVIAEVEGNELFIPEQNIDGYHIEGDGYLNGNVLILSYSVHDHLNSHNDIHYYEASALR